MSRNIKSFLRLSNATGIHRFGEQLTWIQEPDIFHMRFVGTLQADEFKKILEWQAEWGKSKARFYVVCDMTSLHSISRDARKIAGELGLGVAKQAATVVFGASFTVRVVAEMSLRARQLMGLAPIADVIFVSTQADAAAEITRRQNLELQAQSSK